MKPPYADAVQLLRINDQPILWNRRTGRHLTLSQETLDGLQHWLPGLQAPPQLQAVAKRLRELYMLA
ncbi:MAG TPA: hypothetical protein PLA94_13990, partial [Myxococcota bacterium]|nr:hypothetical protein [Myxococcota bacterium]